MILVIAQRRWTDIIRCLRTPRIVLVLAGSTTALAINWLTFIWAVSHNFVVQASLDVNQVSVGQRSNPLGVDAFWDQSHPLLSMRRFTGASRLRGSKKTMPRPSESSGASVATTSMHSPESRSDPLKAVSSAS